MRSAQPEEALRFAPCDLVCTGVSGFGAPKMAMEGSYTTEKVEMSLSGEVSDSKIPGGKANIGMTITSERIGDCKS